MGGVKCLKDSYMITNKLLNSILIFTHKKYKSLIIDIGSGPATHYHLQYVQDNDICQHFAV